MPPPAAAEVALLDGASFVLPYDHALVQALHQGGHRVAVFASRTRYNGEFLQALRALPGVRVQAAAVSRTAAPRWRGLLAYAGLQWRLWRQRGRFACVNLQFSAGAVAGWPLEWPLAWALRRAGVRLAYTVHNAVPHGFAGPRHAPTLRLARLARWLVFASAATRDDFLRRYGAQFADRSRVLPHGLLPLVPGQAPRPVRVLARPEAVVFWGTVKAYKGVALMAELAASAEFRARGLGLEVHGQWDAALHPLRDRLRAAGVRIEDGFLPPDALQRLMARPVLFVLPYTQASQSGALFSLLHQGCTMACSDVGDLGDFLRRHGLQVLCLAERSAPALLQLLDRLADQAQPVAAALQAAQDAHAWPWLMARHRAEVEAVYGPGDAAPPDTIRPPEPSA